ncbi:DEAD/DEAH box helicase [Rhodococcus opacus]|uniref:DEAD/DEAH box helicase n=2 Tax=Rhodococcus opacus TaxID=37919 RepID=A0AAX3YRM5_RHOOP|nr:DEAD/DEAH box helicase [Rhodococcus opacus]MCZ4584394.1 DEAD/DEAH box helicase [Rhodococcus opacus]WLF50722.1 DEAD/DEAH box helicase [Rhodococcus opacus]
MPDDEFSSPTPVGETFLALGLPAVMTHALARGGIGAPFPIQAATIPDVLAGRDVLGRAPTGSGKTLAFGLPMLVRLKGAVSRRGFPRGIVLVPTRELALQIERALDEPALSVGLRVANVVGGIPIKRQVEILSRGVDLLIATPGRLADHVAQGSVSLDDVTVLTLDEADHMADLGFMPQVTTILDKTPAGGQRLLFSATLDGEVDTLVRRYLRDPVTHSTAPVTASVGTMRHHLLFVDRVDKKSVVAHIGSRAGRTLMFVRTKYGVDRLAQQLHEAGISAGALHGGKAQNNRTRTLESFADGTTPVLVATDVAARGIHVDDISLVVHVDPPADPKDYLHRAGRTARAGESGVVVTLVTEDERAEVEKLTRKAGIEVDGVRVRPGDTVLAEITGARRPTGKAVPAPDTRAPAQDTPKKGRQAHDTGGRPARRGRPGDGGAPRAGARRGRKPGPASTPHGHRNRGAH